MGKLRFFNTAGLCNPDDRLTGAQPHRYIKDKCCGAFHAPKQTGAEFLCLTFNPVFYGINASIRMETQAVCGI
jgi:hypothetical protein